MENTLVGAYRRARSRPVMAVAAAIALLLVVSLLSFDSLSTSRGPSKQAAPGTAPAKVGELPERATAASTTRRNRDGSFTTTVYSSPVNYRDRDGRYKPIDPTLHPINEGGYAWRSGANSFEARFKPTLDANFTEFRVGNRVFRTTAVGAAATRATVSGSEVSYPGAYAGADLTYAVGKTGVKEVIHLARPDSPTSYTFRISAADKGSPLSVRKRADGSYWVMAPPLPGPAFVLSAPLVREASGSRQLAPPARDAKPALTVQPVGRDLVVTLSLDENWLHAPGRRFPVQLDPTITIQPDVEDASFIAQLNDYPWTDERLYIGSDDQNTFRSALQFDLSGVPAGTQVTDAKLGLYFDWWCIDPDGLCMDSDHVMDAHRITAPWSTSAQMNSPGFDTAAAGTYTLAAGAPQGWMTWPITSTVQGWLSGALPNYGLLVKRRTEVMNSSGPNPPGARFSGAPALQPKLELTYSGDGVDLIEPATLHGNGADLAWSRYAGQSAFVKYEVHRSSSATFTPSAQTLLATIGDQSVTTYRDTTAAADQTFTYRVVANGSASNPRTVTLPPAGQARKVLQPDPAAGRQTTLNYSTQWTSCDNYGIADEGMVGTSTTDKWREVFYFDLSDIPANATITSATASTWQRAGATAAMTLQAHRLTRPWTEGTTWAYCSGDGATWYETAGGQAWSTPGGDVDGAIAGTVTVPPGDATGFLNLPITGLVQSWVNGSKPNHGFLLRASDETLRSGNSVIFTTDDYTGTSALRPKLTVTYADGNVVHGPKISLAAPAPGSTVNGSTVRLAASAEDDRRVDLVQFLVDGTEVGRATGAPFEVTWNSTAVTNGAHDITVRATDDAGNVSTSAAVSVTVDNAGPPTVSLTAPAAGTVVSAPVTLSASASAAGSKTVSNVAFLVDGVRVGPPATTSPYSVTWNPSDPLAPVFNGSHEVTAVVTDSAGRTTVSAARSVTVSMTGTTLAKAGFTLNSPTDPTDDVMPLAMSENTAAGVPVQDPYAGATRSDGTSGGSLNRALGDAPRNDGGTAPVPLTQATGSTPCATAESADKVIDRSVAGSSTKWCSKDASKWVQAQLTSEQTVSAVVLRHAQAGGEPANWNTRDYDIQTSIDGATWSTALQVRGNTAGTTTHQLTPVRARYVKVVVLVPTQDTNTSARIYELEVYVADRVNPSSAAGSTACLTGATADKVIDRSLSTKWCSTATTKYVQAQLPTTQTVSTVVLRHAQAGGESATLNTRAFNIQTSPDGVTWTTQVQVTANSAAVSTHRLPNPVATRYVRISVVTPAQDTSTTARIYELELYNAPAVTAGSAPPPLCPANAYCPTVNVTNTSGSAWTHSGAQVWYRWYAPNGAIMFEGRSGFGFPTSLAANASQAFPLTIYPPALPPGVQQGTYQLRVDVWDPATATWFSGKGNAPLDNPVIVAKSLATKLGLERYYQYDGEPLGAGMSTLTNIANGNMLARWTPFFSPGRGLSAMADLTYNSLEDHSKSPAGNNFSLSISGLIRLGEPLDIHPNKADEISGKSNKWVEFTDGDGTTHHFDGTTGTDGITRWTEPPGVNLYLRSLPDGDPNGKWALTRPDKVTFYFDADGFPLSVQDRNDNRIRFTLEDTPSGEDPGGPKKRITAVTDAGNRSFLIDYWSKDEAKKAHVRGNIQTITDHSGSRLDFDYYDDGNLLRLTQRGGTNADGTFLAPRSFVFTYTTSNGAGPAIGADGATGTGDRRNPEAKTPNQSTRLYSVIDPRQAETRFAYYQANEGAQLRWKLKSRTNRVNQTTSYGYDLTNRVTTVTSPLARATKFTYDTTGKVTQIVNPKDETTGVQWSADFKVTQVTEPTGKFTTWTYNANGYLTGTTNQTRTETTQLTYTDSAVDANDTGNHLSLLATVTTPKGVATTGDTTDFRTQYSYDSAGNPDRVTDPTGAFVDYDYNLAPSTNRGTVAQVVDANLNPPTVFEAYHASGQPTVIRDPMGKRTRFGYNDDGQVVWIQDPNHEGDTGSDERAYKTFFDYDSFGRLGRQSAPKSTSAERGTLLWSGVEFDPNDNVTRNMDAHYGSASGGDPRTGALTTTTYDPMDRPTLITGPDTSADPAGERTRIDYDAAGRTDKVTKPKGVASGTIDDYTTVYGYDPLDRIVKQTAYGTSTTDVRVTQMCYDMAGDLRSVTSPRAGTVTVTCPGNGPAVAGFTTETDYDAAHRPVVQRDELGHAQRTTYDANGNVTATEADIASGRVARSESDYDQRDNPVTTRERFDGTRNVTAVIEYDKNGNRTKLVSPRAYDTANGAAPTYYVTTNQYDALNRLTRVDLPFDSRDGSERQYVHNAYDANGNLAWTSLPVTAGTATSVADTAKTIMEHFDPGWIRTSDDPANPKVHFDYTAQGWQAKRQTEKRGAPGTLDDKDRMFWDYYVDGQLKNRTDREGQINRYEYDSHNNLTKAFDNGLSDPDEKEVETQATVTGFDEPNKVRHRKQGTTVWKFNDYDYDDNGNVTLRLENGEETDAGTESKAPRRIELSYDGADWLTQQLDLGTDSACKDDSRTVNTWWGTGWEKQRDVYRAAAGCTGTVTTWPKKQTTTWDHFDNGKLKALVTKNGAGTTTESHDVGYVDDAGDYVNGNRTTDRYVLTRAEGNGATTCLSANPCDAKYTYDARDRLLTHQLRVGRTDTYKFDEEVNLLGDKSIRAGNITTEVKNGTTTTKRYTSNQLTEIVAGGATGKYWYDDWGNLDCLTLVAGSQANCSPSDGAAASANLITDYGYDYLNRLTSLRQYGGGTRTDKATYTYDALDRTAKEAEEHSGASTRTTDFTYQGLTALTTEEKQTGGTNPKTKTFSYDAYGHRIAMTDRATGSSGDPTTYTYSHDVHSSVSQLIDDAGKVKASYGYDAFGGADAPSTDGQSLTTGDTDKLNPINPYRYSGKRIDTGTASTGAPSPVPNGSGGYDMGARRYGPDTGSFLQQDMFFGALANLGLALDPLTQNQYALAGGNPISFIETDGHMVTFDGGGGGSASAAPPPPPPPAPKEDNPFMRFLKTAGGDIKESVTGTVDLVKTSFRCEYTDDQAGCDELNEQLKRQYTTKEGWKETWNGITEPFRKDCTSTERIPECAGHGAAAIVEALAGKGAGKVSKLASHACSFTGETQVLMADGSHKPISQVKEGDRVIATDPETGEQAVKTVTAVWVHEDSVIGLDIGGQLVMTTEDHPFWNATDHQWQRADELDPGDKVLTSDGRLVEVNGLRWTTRRTTTAYNLTVDDIHTYYILAGTTPVLVHNTCGYTWAPARAPTHVLEPGEAWHPSQGTPVIGRLPDTELADTWPGHTKLNVRPGSWSLAKNDAWVQTIIDQRGSVYVASPTKGNYWNKSRAEPTVFAREVQQLLQGGYKWSGDYLVPGP